MIKNEQAIKFSKIANQSTPIPDGIGTFQTIRTSSTDGKYLAFYGNNNDTDLKNFYEGLYFAPVDGSGPIKKITDNHTPLPEIGYPTSIVGRETKDAYRPFLVNNAIALAGESTTGSCVDPRPCIVGGKIIFFASNWFERPTGLQGIFSYDIETGTITALLTTKSGPLANGMLGFPSATASYVSFVGAAGPDVNDQAGIWRHNLGTKATSLLVKYGETAYGSTSFQSFGNPIYDTSSGSLGFVAETVDSGTYSMAVFRYEQSLSKPQEIVKSGDVIDGKYKITDGFWAELSYDNGHMIVSALVYGGKVLFSVDPQNQIFYITNNYINTPVPGGGNYDGNNWACPPLTLNGGAIYGAGMSYSGYDQECYSLFGWNLAGKQHLELLIDGVKYMNDGNYLANIYCHAFSFSDGLLVARALWAAPDTGGVVDDGIYSFRILQR